MNAKDIHLFRKQGPGVNDELTIIYFYDIYYYIYFCAEIKLFELYSIIYLLFELDNIFIFKKWFWAWIILV